MKSRTTASFRDSVFQAILPLFSFGVLSLSTMGVAADRIVNGTAAGPGEYTEVAMLTLGAAKCSGTLVGPRVVVTAAICFRTDESPSVVIAGKTYTGKVTRNPIYPTTDHNVAFVLLTADVTGTKPVNIGGTAQVGTGLIIAGYGCREAGGTGNDGVLYWGNNVVTGFKALEMVASQAGGAATCFTDSGGPAYAKDAARNKRVLGVASKGNLKDRSTFARLDIPEAKTFIDLFLSKNPTAKICGQGGFVCADDPIPDVAPTCKITATPAKVKPNEQVTLAILVTGKADTATINDAPTTLPNGYRKVSQATAGTYKGQGYVKGPGGENRCEVSYVVEGDPNPVDPPSCIMTASPAVIKLNESTTVEMTTSGNAATATIENVSVAIPIGKRIFRGDKVGSVTVNGEVNGPGGKGLCSTAYVVQGDDPIDPPGPNNFTVVPVYCGNNTLQTSVTRVCLAVLKREEAIGDMRMNQVVRVQYADGGVEVLPILARKERPVEPGELLVFEDIYLYANVVIPAPGAEVLDTRDALLTKLVGRGKADQVPVAIQGKSGRNQAFYVEKMDPLTSPAKANRGRFTSRR